MDFAKNNNILIFPYSIVILRCTVFKNIYKLQARAFVYHTLFGQDARPRPGPGPRRPRSEEEEAGEPVAGVAAGTEKQYADAVQYCTGEGPLRTGPTVRTETNAKERPVSRSTLVVQLVFATNVRAISGKTTLFQNKLKYFLKRNPGNNVLIFMKKYDFSRAKLR